jgi:hypothetical protein
VIIVTKAQPPVANDYFLEAGSGGAAGAQQLRRKRWTWAAVFDSSWELTVCALCTGWLALRHHWENMRPHLIGALFPSWVAHDVSSILARR